MNSVLSLSVIIPSKSRGNVVECLHAVRRYEPEAWRIVIDDGITPSLAEQACDGLYEIALPGVKPFVYARNVNLGIVAAGSDDVILLNDDALLQTFDGFSLLQQAAREHPEYGVIGATCNNVGNRNQWPQGVGLREDPRIVCFVAVLIPRRTIEAVGLLDERFSFDEQGRRCYGFEDDDYCLRVRRAGLKIGIHDGCFVDHGQLKSTFRGDPSAPADLSVGMKIFVEKWGSHPL